MNKIIEFLKSIFNKDRHECSCYVVESTEMVYDAEANYPYKLYVVMKKTSAGRDYVVDCTLETHKKYLKINWPLGHLQVKNENCWSPKWPMSSELNQCAVEQNGIFRAWFGVDPSYVQYVKNLLNDKKLGLIKVVTHNYKVHGSKI